MDSIHDLGGMEGFGPVEVELNEPTFHFEWEARVWGLTNATFGAGLSNGGEFRHSIERMDAVHYLTSRYYEHWMTGAASRAVEVGWVSVDELEARAGGRFPLSRPVAPQPLEGYDTSPAPNAGAPRFRVGDRVVVRQWNPRGHTRCPRYVRGKEGKVVRIDPAASLADVEAHSPSRRIEPIYCVGFKPRDLWDERTGDYGERDVVHVDLWESYLI